MCARCLVKLKELDVENVEKVILSVYCGRGLVRDEILGKVTDEREARAVVDEMDKLMKAMGNAHLKLKLWR